MDNPIGYVTTNNSSGDGLRHSDFIHYRLSNDYIRGLTDGEGCFTFYPTSFMKAGVIVKQKIPAFVIAMHVRDRWLIIEVAEHLGISGNIYINKNTVTDGHKRGDTARFIVRSLDELREIIIPFFYRKLAGYKGEQFMKWLYNIGNDPLVAPRYKILYEKHKSGYWDNPKNIPERFV